jgi:Arylsulfotransferase (ASST)
MRYPKRTLPLIVLALLALVGSVLTSSGPATAADDHQPQGLIVNRAGASPGYTLFAPLELERTYLMDMNGKIVHTWKTDTRPGLSEYLLPNGHLLRAGNLELANAFKTGAGAGGRVEELDWDGNLLWRFDYANGTHIQHHDIEPMPNGNVLILAWERKAAEEALAAGRSPKLLPDAELWPDSVLEYSPAAGRIVWEWHVWDHLVQDHDKTKANYGDVAAHPEKIDVNYVLEGNGGDKDWNHANGIDYNAARDEIIVSSRSFSEFWVIDHSTTTETTRGPAGDLLFRYGNPATIGADGERTLYVQHDAAWIPDGLPGAGNILVFSNGLPKTRPYSTVEEVTPELVDGRYTRAADGTSVAEDRTVYPTKRADRFFAAIVSSAQRLPNGDTVMTDGPRGTIIEAAADGRVVWEYENTHFTVRKNTPKSSGSGEPIEPWWMFRSLRYAPDYPGLLLVHTQ